jgi:hypothetical protein
MSPCYPTKRDEVFGRDSGPISMRVVAELRAVDVRKSHQFEEDICDASSENGLFIAKVEFSVWTRQKCAVGISSW